MRRQIFITIFHSVQLIGSFSLFQNLELGKASTDDKCHIAVPWTATCQYQCFWKICCPFSWNLSISMFLEKLLSLGLELVNINVSGKFAILWAGTCQYQCFWKHSPKYSKRLKSYGHFSQLTGDKQLHQLSDGRL